MMFKIKKVSKFILDEFIYGGHLQSLGGISIIFVSALLLKIKISWDILIIAYLTFYLIFLHDRFRGINADLLTNPQRSKHLKKYLHFIPTIFVFLFLILSILLIYYGNLATFFFILFFLSFGILYTIAFKQITKKICCFKDLYVATFFALLPFFLLVYYSRPLISVDVLLLSLLIFLEAFLMPVFLDIKDIESDRKEGLQTIPVMLGIKKTITFLAILNFIGTITIMVLIFYLNVLPKSILMLLFTIPFDFYCYSLVKKQKNFGYILQSGKFILWPFLIFIGDKIL